MSKFKKFNALLILVNIGLKTAPREIHYIFESVYNYSDNDELLTKSLSTILLLIAYRKVLDQKRPILNLSLMIFG